MLCCLARPRAGHPTCLLHPAATPPACSAPSGSLLQGCKVLARRPGPSVSPRALPESMRPRRDASAASAHEISILFSCSCSCVSGSWGVSTSPSPRGMTFCRLWGQQGLQCPGLPLVVGCSGVLGKGRMQVVGAAASPGLGNEGFYPFHLLLLLLHLFGAERRVGLQLDVPLGDEDFVRRG